MTATYGDITTADLEGLVERYERLGRLLFVGEAAELAGIPAGRELQQRIAAIAGTTVEDLRAALDSESETGFGALARLGTLIKGGAKAMRSGASKAWTAARAAPGLVLGLASIGGIVLQDVLEPDAEVVQAETMGRVLSEQLDRLPPAERKAVLQAWGEKYAGVASGGGIPWTPILLLGGAFLAWKVLR